MLLLRKGAEAELYLFEKDGQKVILKRRIPKPYRLPQLDVHIRKTRTRREARLLDRARRVGVRTPRVLRVDDRNMEIEMEYVEGERLKEYLLRTGDWRIMKRVGKAVATLNANDIVHGDLTTSNIILSGGDLVFIDFGLGAVSKSIEDKAVDLLCFRRSYFATHPDLPQGWTAFLEGYRDYPQAPAVLKRMEEVARRARYL